MINLVTPLIALQQENEQLFNRQNLEQAKQSDGFGAGKFSVTRGTENSR